MCPYSSFQGVKYSYRTPDSASNCWDAPIVHGERIIEVAPEVGAQDAVDAARNAVADGARFRQAQQEMAKSLPVPPREAR